MRVECGSRVVGGVVDEGGKGNGEVFVGYEE